MACALHRPLRRSRRTRNPAVVADLHEPDGDPVAVIVLAHGAGGNRDGAILQAYAEEFCARGLLVARIDLPYRQRRPKARPAG